MPADNAHRSVPERMALITTTTVHAKRTVLPTITSTAASIQLTKQKKKPREPSLTYSQVEIRYKASPCYQAHRFVEFVVGGTGC